MSKFKIKLKLDLQIEGERDDVPLITEAVRNQVAGLLNPANDVVEGETRPEYIVAPSIDPIVPPTVDANSQKQNVRDGKKSGTKKKPSKNPDNALSWRHNPSQWGNPQTDWNTATKAMWILYIANQETSTSELTSKQIVDTFNVHFNQAGEIRDYNVTRDLNRLTMKPDTPIGKDTTKDPNTWFLTASGEKRVAALISETLGQGNAS